MTAASFPFAASALAWATVASGWMAITPLRPTAGRIWLMNCWLTAPRSALTTPRLMAEAPEIPLKIELKMNARPSGTTTPIRTAERSRSRVLRSFRQMRQAARIGSPNPGGRGRSGAGKPPRGRARQHPDLTTAPAAATSVKMAGSSLLALSTTRSMLPSKVLAWRPRNRMARAPAAFSRSPVADSRTWSPSPTMPTRSARVSSAISLPWSMMPMRSHSRSASSI
jgi:hypothetical protein